MREGLGQPIERVHLDAVHPDLKMEMWTGHTTGGTYFPDQLPRLDMLSNRYVEFRLMKIATENPLAMVDDRDIPADRLQAGERHHPICSGIDIEWMGLRTDPEIDTGMEIVQGPAIVGAAVAITRADAIRTAHR